MSFSLLPWSRLLFYIPLALAAASCVYYLAVTIASLRFHFENDPTVDFTPAISILKPVHGIDEAFYANLASHCREDYPQFEIVFGFSNPNDPARWTIEKLRHDFPAVPIKTVITPQPATGNPKVNKLQRLLEKRS